MQAWGRVRLNEVPLDAPVFVLGYMHSGTTLLQQIMSRNAAVFTSGGETRHFSNLTVTREKYPDLTDEKTRHAYVEYLIRVICTGYAAVNVAGKNPAAHGPLEQWGITPWDIETLRMKAEENRDYNALYVAVFDHLALKAGKRRWLDKLPGYVSQFGQMHRAVPDALFIELIRDPRDILASKKRRTAKGGGYDPLWDSLAWQSAASAGRSALEAFPDQVLRVRYEDLVTESESTVRRICSFLDLSYDPDMLAVGWINTTAVSDSSKNEGISSAAVGTWRKQISPGDTAVSQRIAKNELLKAGYVLAPISLRSYLAVPFILARSALEFFVRLYDRWRQGGARYLLNVLSNYRLRMQSLAKSSRH